MKKHLNREINLNQLTTLVILFLIGGSAMKSTARFAGQNVWIVYLGASLIGALLFTMYYRIAKIHQFKGLPEVLTETFGTAFGKVLLLVYALFFLFRMITVGNYMSEMAQETLMFGANHRLVIAMLLSTIVIGCLYGLNIIGRTSEIFLFIIIVCLIPFLLSFVTTDAFKFSNLVPVLAEGFPGITNDIVRSSFFPFGELVVFLMLFPYISKKQIGNNKVLKRGYIGIGIAVLIMIAIDMTIIGLIGSTLTRNFQYPFYNAMQLAGLKGFLERLDPLAVIIMVSTEFFKLSIYLYITVIALEALHKKFKYMWVLGILTVFTFIAAPLIQHIDRKFLLETIPFKILPIFELFIPLLIWIASELRFRKQKQKAPTQKAQVQMTPGPV